MAGMRGPDQEISAGASEWKGLVTVPLRYLTERALGGPFGRTPWCNGVSLAPRYSAHPSLVKAAQGFAAEPEHSHVSNHATTAYLALADYTDGYLQGRIQRYYLWLLQNSLLGAVKE